MKKKLLLIVIAMLSITMISTAQNRTWAIGTTSASWPAGLAQMASGTQVIDGLTLVAGTSSFGGLVVAPSALVFSDGYDPDNEWTSNGSSSGTAVLPTRRYFSFPVTGPSTIKVWFRVNGTGGRKCQISDGVTLLGEMTDEDNTKPLLLTATYNGTGGTIYVYSNASINYHKIAVTDGILSTDSFQKESDIAVYADNGKIFFSNVNFPTKVNVYNLLGSLIQSTDINNDTSLNINNGIYIVKVQSADGEKSVKVMVQ